MKITVNGEDVFEIADYEKKIICNDILSENFDVDMKRRLKFIIDHKVERCFKRLKEEWEPKLIEAGVTAIPVGKKEFVELVMSQPGYMDRSAREKEAKKNRKNELKRSFGDAGDL